MVLNIVYSDIDGRSTIVRLWSGLWDVFWGHAREHAGGNGAWALIGARPGIEGVSRYVSMNYSGDGTRRKVGPNQRSDIEGEIRNALDGGGGESYYGAGVAFVDGTAGAMSSWIPNVRMVDYMGWALQISLLAALGLATAVVLILRIAHGSGLKRKVSAREYLAGDSIELHYSRDIFLHTQTTQTRRSSDSSGSGGSSGGSSSSRSSSDSSIGSGSGRRF
jgi:hypothetical protein